jgi:uncharacterized protein (TIGR03067 family)
MTTRLLFAALVLFGLTAFAPAPFPKTERERKVEGVSLDQMQGVWTVTKLQTTRSSGAATDSGSYLKEVQITGDRWSFVYREGRNNAVNYTIRIDHKIKPPQLNFYNNHLKDAQPYGMGILKREGNVVQLMYTWGGARATSFEQPPEGHWLITLQRAQ